MKTHGYQEMSHTADIALKVWGESFFTILRQGAAGMYALMGTVCASDDVMDTSFLIVQESWETVMVDFLNELLYLTEKNRLICDDFIFSESEAELMVQCKGYKLLSLDHLIKAVTFHNLSIKKSIQGWDAIITFDV